MLPLLALLALVLLALALYSSLRGVSATAGLIDDLRTERLLPERVLILLADAETAQRGYILTHKTSYLEPLETARRDLPTVLDQIAAADPGVGQEHGLITELQSLVKSRLAEIDATLHLLDESGRGAVDQVMQTDLGKQLMDRTRAAVADLRIVEEARVGEQIVSAQHRTGLATILAALASVALALALAAVFAVRRQDRREELHAEERQRDVETELARISNLVEELPAVIASVRARDLVIEVANSRLRAAVGDIAGRPLDEAIPRAHAPRFTRLVREVIAGGEAFTGTPMATPDGSGLWDLTLLPMRDAAGKIERVLVFALDVTDAERAHAAVERARQKVVESERRLRTLVAGTSQVVFTYDAEGNLAGDTTTWQAFTGLADEELRRDPLAPVHTEDRIRVRAAWRESIASHRPFSAEYRVRRADGREAWLSAEAVPVTDENGTVREWVGTAVDITESKKAEALRELFVGMLGHDLRAPVSAIKTGAELALRRGLPENQARVVGRILSSTERMSRMIDQALDFARARLGGGIPVTRQAMDLGEAVGRIVAEHELAHPDRKISLESQGDQGGNWDEARLGQVVANLVGNAHRYSPPDTMIRLSLDGNAPDEVRLAVQNSGPPIAPDLLRVLFEPFRRGSFKKSGGEDGLGLGLYISSQIVFAHGGTITVTSEAPLGTRFLVSLPRRPPAEAATSS